MINLENKDCGNCDRFVNLIVKQMIQNYCLHFYKNVCLIYVCIMISYYLYLKMIIAEMSILDLVIQAAVNIFHNI